MKTDRNDLLAAINALEVTLRQSASITRENFEARKGEAIELRRRIAEHRTEIFSLISDGLDEGDSQSSFRSRFSKLCAIIALHQANWPVVSIDLQNPDYLASIREVRDAYASFFQWARTVLATRDRG